MEVVQMEVSVSNLGRYQNSAPGLELEQAEMAQAFAVNLLPLPKAVGEVQAWAQVSPSQVAVAGSLAANTEASQAAQASDDRLR